MYIGSHISKHPRGVLQSLIGMKDLGITSCQMFLTSPMGKTSDKTWESMMKAAPEVKEYIETNKLKCFSHLPYTLNFAKDPNTEFPYWIENAKKELKVASAMGFVGCIIHVGKAVKLSQQVATEHMYNAFVAIAEYLKENNLSAKFILETAAGQGSELLVDLDTFATFYNRFTEDQKKHIGICIDTAHIWGAGVDLKTPEAVRKYLQTFDKMIGMKYCTIVHFNNSKAENGGKLDRHESLLEGKIPVEALKVFAEIVSQYGIPLVLETPKGPFDVPVLGAMLGYNVPHFSQLDMMFANLGV